MRNSGASTINNVNSNNIAVKNVYNQTGKHTDLISHFMAGGKNLN
jgi:kynurenine formamidase